MPDEKEDSRTPTERCRDALIVLIGGLERVEHEMEKAKDERAKSN